LRTIKKTGLLSAALIVFVGILTTAMPAFPGAAPRQPGDKPEYTVASTEMSGAANTAVTARVPLVGGLSEKLVLLGVGTLLLGLAAAVRRTV